MVSSLVQQYVGIIRRGWEELLKVHRYSEVEEDLTSNGKWHGGYPNEFRDLGSIAFWKRKGLDGIVIREVKFYSESGNTVHGTSVNLVGDSYRYLKDFGYEQNSWYHRKVTINGREFDSIHLNDSCKFYSLLMDLRRKNKGLV